MWWDGHMVMLGKILNVKKFWIFNLGVDYDFSHLEKLFYIVKEKKKKEKKNSFQFPLFCGEGETIHIFVTLGCHDWFLLGNIIK